MNESTSTETLRAETFLNINVLFRRNWKILFLNNGSHGSEMHKNHVNKLFAIAENIQKLKIDVETVRNTRKVATDLYELWKGITGKVEVENWSKFNDEKKIDKIREDLLWHEYWQLLNRLKENEDFLDFRNFPGRHARLADLYGGFEQILSKLSTLGLSEATDKMMTALKDDKETMSVEDDFRAIFSIGKFLKFD